MKRKSLIIGIIIIALSLFACKATKTSTCDNAVEAKLVNLTGLDGCSWVIELENGNKLEPINLKSFDIKLRNKKKIWVSYTDAKDYVSICMTGKIVRIECIENR